MDTENVITFCAVAQELEAAAREEQAKGNQLQHLQILYSEVALAIRRRARLHIRECPLCQTALASAAEAA